MEPNNIITTFEKRADSPLCLDKAGKPIVRLFVVAECEKCKKVEKVYVPVAKEYLAKGWLTARLWYKDRGDDLLTDTVEGGFPAAEEEVCFDFDLRCENSLMVVGCQYYRTGAPHGTDYDAEEKELRSVFDQVVEQSGIKEAAAVASPAKAVSRTPVGSRPLVWGGAGLALALIAAVILVKIKKGSKVS